MLKSQVKHFKLWIMAKFIPVNTLTVAAALPTCCTYCNTSHLEQPEQQVYSFILISEIM